MVTDVVIAEDALTNPRGALSLYSVLTEPMYARAFPARVRRLAVLARWEALAPIRARVALFAPDGALLADAGHDVPPLAGYWHLVILRDLQLSAPGRYRLTFFAGGLVAREVGIMVEQEEEEERRA